MRNSNLIYVGVFFLIVVFCAGCNGLSAKPAAEMESPQYEDQVTPAPAPVVAESEGTPGVMGATPNGATINDKNDNRTAAAQAFNSGKGGNSNADAQGWKSTATSSNVGENGTATATATDPFKDAKSEMTMAYTNEGTQMSAEAKVLKRAAEKAGTSAKATNIRPDGTVVTASDKVFDLSKLGGMRFRVAERKNWDTDINKNVHPHTAPIRSEVEGGPAGIEHKDIEFTRVNPGTIICESEPAENNFIYGLWVVESLGPFGYNPMQVAALRAHIKGTTTDGDWVLGAYFYLSDMLVETDSPIVVAPAPWRSKQERIQDEKSTYEKLMGQISDPNEEIAPKPKTKSTARGEKTETIDQRE
jgi:hypothetical protein